MKHSQKMALIPCEDLMQKKDNGHISEPTPRREIPGDFLKEKLYSLDDEISRILNNATLSPEEKVKLYNQCMVI